MQQSVQRRFGSQPNGQVRTRDAIRNHIFTNFWNDDLHSFVQSKGTKDLDAPAIGKILEVCDPAVEGEKSIFRRNRSGQPTALFGASNFSADRSGKRATPESFELAVAVPGGSALVSRPGDTFQC